jgi:methionyl-tRNA synthetase
MADTQEPSPTIEAATAATAAVEVSEVLEGAVSPFDRWTLADPASIDYGHFSGPNKKNHPAVASSSGAETTTATATTTSPSPPPFYITTAINYTNGPAHMGHAYEAVTTDVLARFYRLTGAKTYFLTGSDEHGQKIAETARANNRTPIDICDQYATGFQVLNQRLLITNDDYVRTTSDRHKATARQLWQLCAHDIYIDAYSGWYNVREENFVTETDAALTNYIDPVSSIPYKHVEEESYFFKMSKYQTALLSHIQEHVDFIRPEQYRNLTLNRLQEELRDLSISRTTFDWGISVPNGFKSDHVMYVWVDALSNYLTGVDALQLQSDNNNSQNLSQFWPANCHIIGKDILWFHTVIWPCLLMSAGLPLPQTVFAHGFVNDADGKKMSKSLGNVIDPHDMLDLYDVDTFRWYLCKEAPYGSELAFSENSLRGMHNSDLCDTLGNLVHRATTLCTKYAQGRVPDVPIHAEAPRLAGLVTSYETKMKQFELEGGAALAMQGFRDVNGFLQDKAPWHIRDDLLSQQVIARTALEAIYILTHLMIPFTPVGAAKIFRKLNTPPVPSLAALNVVECRNLASGTVIDIGDILYGRLLSQDEQASIAAGAGNKPKESHADAQKRKKEAQARAIAASQTGTAAATTSSGAAGEPQSEFTMIDIRVGVIQKIWNHTTADKLYCEEINVGEAAPREICSGLRDYYSLEELQGRKVLVVCNLKAAKIVGFTSNGMVLAAKRDGQVELVEAPPDAIVGEQVTIDGVTGEPATSTQVKKKKIWEAVAAKLITGENGVATWDGRVLQTSTGPCRAATLVGAPIS